MEIKSLIQQAQDLICTCPNVAEQSGQDSTKHDEPTKKWCEQVAEWTNTLHDHKIHVKAIHEALGAVYQSLLHLDEQTETWQKIERYKKILQDQASIHSGKLKWEDVYMEVIDNETIEIKINGLIDEKKYHELGFGDERCLEKKPIILWEKFLRLAEKPKRRIFDCSKKDVQRIRNRLKKHFRINDNPINPYISTRKWSCKFHFIDQRR